MSENEPRLIYFLIAKELTVLCSYTEFSGNFEVLALKLLKKVEKNHRGTFSHGDE